MPKFTDGLEINLKKFYRDQAKIEFIIIDKEKILQYVNEINGDLSTQVSFGTISKQINATVKIESKESNGEILSLLVFQRIEKEREIPQLALKGLVLAVIKEFLVHSMDNYNIVNDLCEGNVQMISNTNFSFDNNQTQASGQIMQ